jgi:phosphatidylglycerol:prolipoprotein diacylglycerol transferase
MINGFTILGVKIYFYAIIIIIGAVAGAFLAAHEAKRKGFSSDIVWDVLPWLLIAGIIGARLWHVFTPSDSMLIDGKNPYFIYPLDIIKIRAGGLGIPGGVIGGVIALWLYTRKKKLVFGQWMDTLAPGVALAQAIGRWGNFVNQELYGYPTTLPWGIKIDALHGGDPALRYHPLFFYEFLLNLLNVGILLLISRKWNSKFKNGDVFLIYVSIYSFGRFFLEFLKVDQNTIWGLYTNQLVMAVLFVFSVGFLLVRHLSGKKTSAENQE